MTIDLIDTYHQADRKLYKKFRARSQNVYIKKLNIPQIDELLTNQFLPLCADY